MLRQVIILFSLFLLVACANRPQSIGFAEKDIKYFDQLTVLEDNKEKVIALLGQPTIISDFSPQKWYYISFNNNIEPFTKDKVNNFAALELQFNDKGYIIEKKIYTKDQLNKFAYDKNRTPTKGVDASLIGDVLGNIGKINSISKQ